MARNRRKSRPQPASRGDSLKEDSSAHPLKSKKTRWRVLKIGLVILVTGAATWTCVGFAFIPSPPAVETQITQLDVEAVVMHLSETIHGSNYGLEMTLAPGTEKVNLSSSSATLGGAPAHLGLPTAQVQCWTVKQNNIVNARTTYGYEFTRTPHQAPLFIGKPGQEYIDPCPVNGSLELTLDSPKVGSAFEHEYLRIPRFAFTAQLPAGSNRDSAILKQYMSSDINLTPFYFDPVPANARDLKPTSIDLELASSDCTNRSDLGTVADTYECLSDGYWADYADTDSPQVTVFMPSVVADYATDSYAGVREILLLVIGALVALGLAAVFALVVPS